MAPQEKKTRRAPYQGKKVGNKNAEKKIGKLGTAEVNPGGGECYPSRGGALHVEKNRAKRRRGKIPPGRRGERLGVLAKEV